MSYLITFAAGLWVGIALASGWAAKVLWGIDDKTGRG